MIFLDVSTNQRSYDPCVLFFSRDRLHTAFLDQRQGWLQNRPRMIHDDLPGNVRAPRSLIRPAELQFGIIIASQKHKRLYRPTEKRAIAERGRDQ